MEDVYQKLIEYKNLYPIAFWVLLSVLSCCFLIILKKLFFKNGDRKLQPDKVNRQEKPPEKSKSNDLKETVHSHSKNKKQADRNTTEPKENKSTPPKKEKVNETKVDYKPPKKTIPSDKVIKRDKKPPELKEKLPEAEKEPKKESRENIFVNYETSIENNISSYPVFMCPEKGCIVRSHRKGSTKRKGYKEKHFQRSIEEYFSSEFVVSGNIRINTGKNTRPFEPDIAILDLKSNKNIRIDIEIDEPYAGITRQATHCAEDDYLRDSYFIDRGWIVVRFSEYQVHTQLNKCLKFIANIISSIKPDYSIPQNLIKIEKIDTESFWDLVQAQKWEKEKYREKYLDHTFKEIIEKPETVKRDFDEQEIAEEKLVKTSVIGAVDSKKNTSFNKVNLHPRDKRIEFYPEPHNYKVDGVGFTSATTIISKFFPEFDPDQAIFNMKNGKNWGPGNKYFGMSDKEIKEAWDKKGKIALEKGSSLHQQIEKFYLGEDYKETQAFSLFKQFVEDHSNLSPYRSEWRIFDDKHHIAGTIDLIAKNGSGFEMYDWKRSKRVINTFDGSPIASNSWQNGIGKLNHLDDTSYNRYCLQQSLYRYVLEKNYGIRVSKMFLVILYPKYDQYYKVQAPYLKEETEHIMNTLLES